MTESCKEILSLVNSVCVCYSIELLPNPSFQLLIKVIWNWKNLSIYTVRMTRFKGVLTQRLHFTSIYSLFAYKSWLQGPLTSILLRQISFAIRARTKMRWDEYLRLCTYITTSSAATKGVDGFKVLMYFIWLSLSYVTHVHFAQRSFH